MSTRSVFDEVAERYGETVDASIGASGEGVEFFAMLKAMLLRAELGNELLELRIDGDAPSALDILHAHGIAGDDAFSVGSTVIVPLHDRPAAGAIAAVHEAGLPAAAITARRPTLDDVYLRLTGASFGPD